MTGLRAVIVTTVVDVDHPPCDHGCHTVVRLTNILDDTTWEMCLLSFENMVGRALYLIDHHARGGSGMCDDVRSSG
ncbi:MAG: hypothetical protein K6T78_16310 [Alicyclobacillus sp.]|nr:hypothetical protein [Alicyclobacillus sp.]